MNEKLILIVDDEFRICEELAGYLTDKGYQTLIANNGLEAYDLFITNQPVCVLTDYRMPMMNGLELLKKIKRVNNEIHVILISGVADIKTVVEAMKNDAFDFLAKPVDLKDLAILINIAVKKTLDYRKRQVDDRMSSIIYHMPLEKFDTVSVLYFNKDIDEQMKEKFHQYISELMNERILKKFVIFHLGNAKYINNIGLNFLIDMKSELSGSNRQLYLSNLNEQVATYIQTLGYNKFFDIEKNISDVQERIRLGGS